MTGLSPQLRFEGFVVGGANRLAATAARAVAESPGAGYNPLFIYAKPGLGKTHLLMAIGHAARAIDPALVVEYMTLDDFVEAYHTAVGAGQGETYRRRFVEAGLVLLDDVQFLTQRRETQAELIRLIDQMQSAGRQIVLTSDRPPSEIEALDERLLRRVGGGLVIDIAAPDYETRVAILRRKAEERGVVFAPGVLEAIGALAIDNVRELLGALNRLVAFQAVSDAPLDAAQARLLLGVRGPAPDAPPMGLPAGGDGATPALAVPAAARGPQSEPAADEFGAFLSEVADTLTRQVEQWRRRTEEAILRWEGEGFRVDRLRALLAHELDTDPAAAIAGYERDVERLRELEREARGLSEDLAGSAVFRNPDDLTAAEAALAGAREGTAPPPAPEALWALDDLVESVGNRLALRSARHVVESPTAETNPLVVIGGAGVGKTHLLHGLGNALLTRPGAVVACQGAQDFVAELIEAIERDRVGVFRNRYRRVTAFLLDDVQLIAGKERTQEELFLLFNHLHERGVQMAFTSSVPLKAMSGVEPRLISRLKGGLLVELPPPERVVCHAVTDRLLTARFGKADPELVSYLAGRPVESVRALQGLVQRVVAAADGHHVEPTAALAREVIEGVTSRPARPADAPRSSGVVAGTSGGSRSREKMVWDWPDAPERIAEEWR